MVRTTQKLESIGVARRPFTLKRARVLDSPGAALMEELSNQTGSDVEAASILRCVQRLGDDASIESYEMTPTNVRRTYRDASPVVWSVRAVRR